MQREGEKIRLVIIDLGDPIWDGLDGILSASERSRLDRILVGKRTPLVRSRIALRCILAHLSGREPSSIEFSYGEFGKPEAPELGLCFNVSHSVDRGLIAISDQAVGVDIESVRQSALEVTELARLVLHSEEARSFDSLSHTERPSYFYEIWVRKEAYLKALGVGLQRDARDIFVGICDPSDVAFRVRDEHYRQPFYVQSFWPSEKYVASVCSQVAYPSISVLNARLLESRTATLHLDPANSAGSRLSEPRAERERGGLE